MGVCSYKRGWGWGLTRADGLSLHRDLLKQAHRLARHEPRRPRQASLRRAVSTARYAVFHLMVDAASREIVSGQGQEPLRQGVRRALNHSDMKKACQTLVNWNRNNPSQPLAMMMPRGPNTAVVTMVSAFVDLQQARHDADYDLSCRFSRADAFALLRLADGSFDTLHGMRKAESSRRIFLLTLVFHGRWKR